MQFFIYGLLAAFALYVLIYLPMRRRAKRKAAERANAERLEQERLEAELQLARDARKAQEKREAEAAAAAKPAPSAPPRPAPAETSRRDNGAIDPMNPWGAAAAVALDDDAPRASHRSEPEVTQLRDFDEDSRRSATTPAPSIPSPSESSTSSWSSSDSGSSDSGSSGGDGG